MPTLTIVRGIPGSGKSTYAISKDGYHIESDMFFIKDGVYSFDGQKIAQAHQWCREKTCQLLDEGQDVIVSNTFTQIWEMKPYLDMASEDVSVKVVKVVGNFKNVHGVPDSVLDRMKARWEDFDGEEVFVNNPKD